MTQPNHSFPARLKSLREQQRLSKTSLAKRVGVTTTCVWNWEEGNTLPRSDNLVALARVLNVAADHLESGSSWEGPTVQHEDENSAQRPLLTLSEVIAEAKRNIASLAGIDSSKVTISLDY